MTFKFDRSSLEKASQDVGEPRAKGSAGKTERWETGRQHTDTDQVRRGQERPQHPASGLTMNTNRPTAG